MQADEFLRRMEEFKDRNLFVIQGDEPYLMEQAEKALIDSFGLSFPEMNLTVLQDKAGYSDIWNTCMQAPCFASSRATVIDGIDVSSKDLDFSRILDELPKETKLVIVMRSKPDLRKSVYKRLKEEAVTCECNSLNEGMLVKWIKVTGKRKGVMLSDSASRLLLEITGADMNTILNEIEKMKFLMIRSPSEKEIRETVSGTLEYDIFEFHNCMMDGEYDKAFSIYESFRKNRDQVLGFIGLLTGKFTPMYLAKGLMMKGMPERGAADMVSETMGIKPYPALLAARDAKRFTLREIKNSIRELEEMDRRVKTFNKINDYKSLFLRIYNRV